MSKSFVEASIPTKSSPELCWHDETATTSRKKKDQMDGGRAWRHWCRGSDVRSPARRSPVVRDRRAGGVGTLGGEEVRRGDPLAGGRGATGVDSKPPRHRVRPGRRQRANRLLGPRRNRRRRSGDGFCKS